MEVGPDLVRECPELVEELGPGDQLGHYHVVPGGQMCPNRGERYRPCPASRLGRVVPPSAEHGSQLVDVEAEGERVTVGEHPTDRGLPVARRAVQQYE